MLFVVWTVVNAHYPALFPGGFLFFLGAPNPAGQALLGRFFGGAISPVGLLAAALIPTLVAVIAFRVL